MTVGIVLAIVGGVLLLLLLVPVWAAVEYTGELTVRVRVWGIPVYRFSSRDRRPASDSGAQKPGREARLSDLSHRLKVDSIRTVVEECRALADVVKKAVGRLLRAVVVDKLALQITVASADAAATAVNTGRICAVLYPSLTAIQSVVRIRHRAVTVTPDYLAESGNAQVRLRMHAVPIRLLWMLLCVAVSYLARRHHHTKVTKEDTING